jgi:alanine racemase
MCNTWVEIDQEILSDNISLLKKSTVSGVEIIFVVKANAYGHGMAVVAEHAFKNSVEWFAVAHAEEAVRLHKCLPKAKIIVLGVVTPNEVLEVIGKNIFPVIIGVEHARSLAAKALSRGSVLQCHAKIDTGMGRLGFGWETAAQAICQLDGEAGLKITGICSHFSSACSGKKFATIQAAHFFKVIESCEKMGMKLFRHISNSGGIIENPAWDMDAIRPGIALYGYSPRSQLQIKRNLKTKPFLQWKTSIVQIKKVPAGFPVSYDGTFITRRETHLATINVGYADGYFRSLSNKGSVIINDVKCRIIGRVTMNLSIVDLGPDHIAEVGNEVILLGSSDGQSIWADEIAELCETIPYEILTSIKTNDRRIKK